MTRDSNLAPSTERWLLSSRLAIPVESAPIWIEGPYFVSGDCFGLMKERRHDVGVGEWGRASEDQSSRSVVISCQKGVRLTYYQPNELGAEISNGSVTLLSRNQNDNGTEVRSEQGD